MKDITGEILQALMVAPPSRKQQALKLLRGEYQPEPTTGPLLYSMSEAARVLGVSRTTFWRLFQTGQLKKVQVMERSYRVRRADVEALARDGMADGEAGAQ
jgi:excisionase family DNA binding protein